MKIIILDGNTENPGDLSWDPIGNQGDLVVFNSTAFEEIIPRMGDAEIIFTNKTPITREIFAACPSIKYVGVLATGYNIVDVAAAKEFGVVVTNIPTYGTTAVAQYVFALLLELCHHVGHHSETVHAGRWGRQSDFCYWDYPLIELEGKTIGLVGYGRIGKATGHIARAFGMDVIACASRPVFSDDLITDVTFEELLSRSDVISLHCPLSESTRGIINKDSISKAKDGVLLINTARGALIVEEDLKSALENGKVAGAALDVLSVEPPRQGNVLIGVKNCIITPHIAWAPRESRGRLMEIAANNLEAWINGAAVNVVNL